jgi:hypothetical protein
MEARSLHRTPRPAAAALAVLVALVTVPAAARAARLTVAPCSKVYPGQESVPIGGEGFTPLSTVALESDGRRFATAQTDELGNFAVSATAPPLSSPRRTHENLLLSAVDPTGLVARTAMRISRVGATMPARARPGDRVRFRVYGFEPGTTIYLHVRRAGQTVASIRIGRAVGPCGDVSRTLAYVPLRRYRPGAYVYYFEAARQFTNVVPYFWLPVVVMPDLARWG